jgi:hypothetical protein
MSALVCATVIGAGFAGVADGNAATVIHPTVRIYINTSSITSGGKVVIHGSVAPNQHGHWVHLQRYYSGAWHADRAQTLSAASTYAFTLRPSAVGKRTYRVLDAAASGWAAAASNSVSVTVKAPVVQSCTPGYRPCIPPGPDVDCAGGSGNGPRYVVGPVYVTGSDPYDLDRDGDGVGCE